jgi:hypothetical protein
MLKRPCYRVTFSDHTAIVADGDHRWATLTRKPKGAGVFTTQQIMDTLYWHPTKPYANHRIPLSLPLELPNIGLPIPPYTLGIWLGDGSNANSMITQGSNDIIEIERYINAEGIGTKCYRYQNRAPNLWLNGLNPRLRALGLLHNKHIPTAYLRGSYSQRLALIQGLMDSDGTAALVRTQPQCAFSSTNELLAKGTLELARTLGLRPTWQTKPAKLNGKSYGDYYKISFTPRDDVPVFRLSRKASAAKRNARKTSQALARTIIAIEPVESMPVRCVAVDTSDHLFLAGLGMVPTHNTELAAWIAACELHHEGPVRCDGFDKAGWPLGRPVTDPYIPLVAYTEAQSEELAYGTLHTVLSEGPLAADFDIGLERIARRRGDGKAVPLATAPNARDGARTTFQVADETHWWTLPRLKQAHQVMMMNLPKRRLADAWALEVTTAPEPGARSVAEETMDYAITVAQGRIKDSRLFYFHRQASDEHNLETEEGARAAVLEASGPTAAWRDIDAIVEMWRDPTTDRTLWERMWCNRLVKSSAKAFDQQRWVELARTDYVVRDGALVTLGFDGGLYHDATGLVMTEVETGHQQVLGVWEQPFGAAGERWQVPDSEVDDAVTAAFVRYNIWRLYGDPAYWEGWMATWAGRYGAERVVEWRTNRPAQMSAAIRAYQTAIQTGALSHDGHEGMARHIGNAFRRELRQRDDQDRPLYYIRKERSDSPHKIDLAMAGILSWEARNDGLTAGAQPNQWTIGAV